MGRNLEVMLTAWTLLFPGRAGEVKQWMGRGLPKTSHGEFEKLNK
jgi:hypothetical protein